MENRINLMTTDYAEIICYAEQRGFTTNEIDPGKILDAAANWLYSQNLGFYPLPPERMPIDIRRRFWPSK